MMKNKVGISKKFTDEFVIQCVNLVINKGQRIVDVASKKYVGITTLKRWVKLFRNGDLNIINNEDIVNKKQNKEIARKFEEIEDRMIYIENLLRLTKR